MAVPKAPAGLDKRGRRLWRGVHLVHELDPAQTEVLAEACRIADRLERLDAILRGETHELVRAVQVDRDEPEVHLVVDAALSEARQQANVLKQLLVSIRLPDQVTGRRPQHRGARGAYQKGQASGQVSSLERARRRAAGR